MKLENRIFSTFFFILSFFLFFTFLNSAPHISGKHFLNEPKVKPRMIPSEVYNLRKKGAPAKEIAKFIGTIGTKKIAVIIVDFPDKQFSSDWTSQANQTFTQLKDYYDEVSYGKLKLDITFFHQGGSTKILSGNETPYRMPRNMKYYGQDTNSSLSQLIKDGISSTGGAVYKIFYDYVMVLHAGYGNESTNNPDDIWSVYVDWDDAINGFNDGTIVPERELGASPVGVVCHEFGHQLGLPDLYYDQESIVGSWCLMDYGVWLGSPQGSKPAHLSAWCKQFLGWVEPEIVSSTLKNVVLHYVETVSTAVIKVPIITATKPDKEYFLLEYRRKVNFDSDLPGAGLLVWKIDDEIASSPDRIKNNNINSGTPHYGIDLIEADRSSAGKNFGDTGDPFPGSNEVTIFFPQEYNITAYNGNPINIMLTNIATDTENAYFDIVSFSGLYATVTRLNGVPLNDVRIELYKDTISTVTHTSVNGIAVVELSTGVWNVQYSLQHYLTYYDIITVFPEQLTVRNVILRYDPSFVVQKNNFVIGNNYFDYSTMDKMVFRYNLESASDVKIIIYTLSGNVVKSFENYHTEAGFFETIWNVKDEQNNNLSPGVYFVVFKSKFNKKVEKFVIKYKI